MASEVDRRRWAALREGPFPYSTKQINRAGERIRHARVRGEEPSVNDLTLLDDYRAWHYPTLRQVQDRISRLLHKKRKLPPAVFRVTARPLKTPEAIMAKLVREKTRLATMQDIAGTRVRVPTLEFQELVATALLKNFEHCEPDVTKDSRVDGNKYGYRALHVVISLESRYAEIQIRTSAQEAWAQVVERLDEQMGTDLKHGRGPAEWLEWLHALSDALREMDLGREVDLPPSPWDEMSSE